MTDEKNPPKTYSGMNATLLINGKPVGKINEIGKFNGSLNPADQIPSYPSYDPYYGSPYYDSLGYTSTSPYHKAKMVPPGARYGNRSELAKIMADRIIREAGHQADSYFEADLNAGYTRQEATERYWITYAQQINRNIEDVQDAYRADVIKYGMNNTDPYLRELLNRLLTELQDVEQRVHKPAQAVAQPQAKIKTAEEVFDETNRKLATYRESTKKRRHL